LSFFWHRFSALAQALRIEKMLKKKNFDVGKVQENTWPALCYTCEAVTF